MRRQWYAATGKTGRRAANEAPEAQGDRRGALRLSPRGLSALPGLPRYHRRTMAGITLKGVRKAFGSTVAVDSVTLEVRDGELFFLLGPSGCGKTTLLRIIAGFEAPEAGRIVIGDEDVTRLPPEKRRTGMVFQNYALWPHMTVAENVDFGLKVRRLSAAERHDRTAAALKAVRMQDYARRRPNQLSGGQQQRVALARALVIEPRVLLLDEPLSNLDARLRSEMRTEIRRLCSEAAITSVCVTHDQTEALSMADRLAVMREGRIVQVGRPRDVYQRPENRFVADFLGETNFISAEVKGAEAGELILHAPMGEVRARGLREDTPRSGNLTCSIRPEAWRIEGDGSAVAPAVNTWNGRLIDTVYHGEAGRHEVELDGDVTIHVLEANPRDRMRGQSLRLHVDPADVVVLAD